MHERSLSTRSRNSKSIFKNFWAPELINAWNCTRMKQTKMPVSKQCKRKWAHSYKTSKPNKQKLMTPLSNALNPSRMRSCAARSAFKKARSLLEKFMPISRNLLSDLIDSKNKNRLANIFPFFPLWLIQQQDPYL